MNPLEALAALHDKFPMLEPGHVWLAGAGPGDPGLLTLDALAGLAQADVIVHDALVDARVLALADPQARTGIRRQARRPALGAAGRHHRAADRTGARAQARAAAQGRRPLHVRPRRRGGDRARRRRHSLSSSFPASPRALRRSPRRRSRRPCAASTRPIIFVTGHADADFDWAALARTGQPIVIYMAMRNVEPIVQDADARRACGRRRRPR